MILRSYRRFFVVAYQFLPVLFAYARDRHRYVLFGPPRQVTPETRKRRARSLLDSLLRLGPTFIKLGQLLSTRPDILPPEYIDEFEQLQDRVPPAPWPEARAVVEAELGPLAEAFDDFDEDAISGASLGQVYVADLDGQQVAVKVRRPGVEDLVEADLRVIRFSLPLLLPFLDEARSFSLETLADEFANVIRQEMDYEREARMLEEIRSNFVDDPTVRIPASVPSHCTPRVLTMEYVPGTKISDIDDIDRLGVDRDRLADRLQRVYLQMMIEDGVFHADPHPGNLAVQDDGTLVFYDFGMSGRVDPFIQEKIVDFYLAVAEQDVDAILDTLVEMGTLSPEADREVMANVMELAIADVRGEDIEQYRIQQVISQVEDTIYEFPLRLPSNLALIMRVATVVEGVCVTLSPDFDFIETAQDYLREEGYLQESARQYVREQVQEVNNAAQSAVRLPRKLEETLDRIDRDSLTVQAQVRDEKRVLDRLARRVVLGVLLAATLLATTVLYAFSTLDAATLGLELPAVGLVASLVLLALLYRSFRRRKGIRATPQFTRQSMRQHQDETAALGMTDREDADASDDRDES
ncbi:MAG: ABC1 kinase family protein [Haloarculaceae archaeon]